MFNHARVVMLIKPNKVNDHAQIQPEGLRHSRLLGSLTGLLAGRVPKGRKLLRRVRKASSMGGHLATLMPLVLSRLYEKVMSKLLPGSMSLCWVGVV